MPMVPASALNTDRAEAGAIMTAGFVLSSVQATWLRRVDRSADLFLNNLNVCAKRANCEEGARTICRCLDSTYCRSRIVSHSVYTDSLFHAWRCTCSQSWHFR